MYQSERGELERIIEDCKQESYISIGDRPIKELNTQKLAQSIIDAGFIKIKPFEWMERWLKSYDNEHKTNLAKEVLEWINQQPMTQG